MSLHAVVLTIPAHGHMNPALAVVEEMLRRGHRVSFLTSEPFDKAVDDAGADRVPYPSGWPAIAPSTGQATPDEAAATPLLYLEENLAQLTVAEEAFAADRPDVIIFDATASFAGRALSRRLEVPSLVLNTTFASNKELSLAREMTAGYESEAGQVDAAHSSLVLFGEKLARFLTGYHLDTDSLDDFAVNPEAVKLVFTTRSFQLRGETFDSGYAFVGPCVSQSRLAGTWKPAVERPRSVLVSMGTQVTHQPALFRACAEAFDGLPWQVVLVVGSGFDTAGLGPLPANVEIHASVPQPLVLRHVDAFVTHGGMNSTMESLASGVPVVVVPMTPEQRLIGARAAELGLGRLLSRDGLEPRDIRRAVLAVSGNADMAARIEAFRTELEGAGASLAVDEIEKKAASPS